MCRHLKLAQLLSVKAIACICSVSIGNILFDSVIALMKLTAPSTKRWQYPFNVLSFTFYCYTSC